MDPIDIDSLFQGCDPSKELFTSIDAGNKALMLQHLEQLRQDPNVSLAPCLLHCIQTGEKDALKIFLDQGILPDESAVEAAVRTGDITTIDTLLEHGWDINASLRGGVMPSLICFAVANESLLDSLLHRGAHPNALSCTAETPLSVAVREGSIGSIMKLLDAGGDARLGNLLHRAVERTSGDSRQVLELLISRGAAVDQIEYDHPVAQQLRYGFPRGTALHKACKLGNADAVAVLRAHGASVNCKLRQYNSEIDVTPFGIAESKDNQEIIAMLR
ncbi:hypothetical protein LTR91_022082 [Friedmanniomyces endolithicus]|uniref:Uncharacterized protein n=2 Tax=Dothideomycetidae TaxID=451867 RepID=A0AAN6H6V6_9PEZI|nr:hypothetical protein LTR94_022079 [Friedmanniomyces endolithicus]KAK5140224.1 hypothetical protein LTR32_006913 [Rachicladosporium monterosium]KAK0769166.1 hypothetical protein LTR59_017193 [Friedmanniomyces endolithicus]KAK0772074.1 hypothetical protein LTR38_017008 [Friedmanniomyces endolithicus]KAK0773168.1 hypothetical protein LTR75_017201 [Friedmanniomyces endolithicus]